MDYLSWVVPVSSSSIEDLTEPVVVTAAEQVSPPESSHPTPLDPPPTISEVIPGPSLVENSVTTDPDAEPIEEDNTIDGDTGRYILPHRTTGAFLRKDTPLRRLARKVAME